MTGTTRPTPASTPASPGITRLAFALRELRTRTGLSLAALAAKTAYSKSSWERYLNAGALPPRPAVRALCRLAGEPDSRYLALWEIADSEWGGRAEATTAGAATSAPTRATAPPPPHVHAPPDVRTPAAAPLPPARGTPSDHRSVAVVAVLASLCAVVFGVVMVGLLLLPHQRKAPSAPTSEAVTGPLCRGSGCEGRSPMRQRCASAPATLASRHTSTGAWLELRYSGACGTGWARMWGTAVGDRLEMTAGEDRPAREARVRSRGDADTYVYTLMTATGPGTVVRACLHPAGGGARECVEARVR